MKLFISTLVIMVWTLAIGQVIVTKIDRLHPEKNCVYVAN